MTPAVRAPGVTFHTFVSAAAKTNVSFHLYTPAVYDTEKKRRFRCSTGYTARAWTRRHRAGVGVV